MPQMESFPLALSDIDDFVVPTHSQHTDRAKSGKENCLQTASLSTEIKIRTKKEQQTPKFTII